MDNEVESKVLIRDQYCEKIGDGKLLTVFFFVMMKNLFNQKLFIKKIKTFSKCQLLGSDASNKIAY